jgi:hypothetical protein
MIQRGRRRSMVRSSAIDIESYVNRETIDAAVVTGRSLNMSMNAFWTTFF